MDDWSKKHIRLRKGAPGDRRSTSARPTVSRYMWRELVDVDRRRDAAEKAESNKAQSEKVKLYDERVLRARTNGAVVVPHGNCGTRSDEACHRQRELLRRNVMDEFNTSLCMINYASRRDAS